MVLKSPKLIRGRELQRDLDGEPDVERTHGAGRVSELRSLSIWLPGLVERGLRSDDFRAAGE